MTMDEATKKVLDQALAGATHRPLHRTLFNFADCYDQASQMAYDCIESKKNADFVAPAIMCKSFAIELLLKFFIVVDYPTAFSKSDIDAANVNLRGHSFSSLFDRISPRRQSDIAQKHSERTGATVTPAAFRAFLVELGDDPFVSWRYVYESTDQRYMDGKLLQSISGSLGMAAQDATRRA